MLNNMFKISPAENGGSELPVWVPTAQFLSPIFFLHPPSGTYIETWHYYMLVVWFLAKQLFNFFELLFIY